MKRDGSKSAILLMADDDPGDVRLTRIALEKSRLHNELHVVGDGQELLDYLRGDGQYGNGKASPRPDLILLDLNMPGMDGREALSELKNDRELRRIPIVVLTTSDADEDIFRSYDLGANSYIRKPVTMEGLAAAIGDLERYWFELVVRPPA